MAERRFNIARQGEQMMNDKVFKAYNRIKYIGNGLNKPIQEYQAPIQDYSLWTDRTQGTDILNSYNQSSQVWNPLFKGYYHPANLKEQPLNPVEGQSYIDFNGVLRYYEDKQWKPVHAVPASNISNVTAGISNFLLMPDMKPITGSARDYLVPYLTTGKLFDNKKYMSTEKFTGEEIRLTYPLVEGATSAERVSWVHINPAYLYNARKRLIKILDSTKTNNWFINVPTVNTEFYGFKSGEPKGTILRYIQSGYDNVEGDINSEIVDTVSDYRKVSGGIQLINAGRTYDFIYAITYKFDNVEKSYGYVLHDNVTIGGNNEVYVGQIKGFPLVFLNGTYLEQNLYTYNSQEGMLSFSGTEITNEMDLTVAAFADVIRYTLVEYPGTELEQRPPFELTIKPTDIDEHGTIIKQHEYIKQASNFKHPIVFVQGIASMYDTTYGITDEVEIDATAGIVKVFNYGPLSSDISLIIADIGDAKMSSGLTKDGYIEDVNITDTKSYIAFINGICTSPSDHEVSVGKIKSKGITSGQQYILMSLDKGDKGIDLLFDSTVSYFTTQINDKNASVAYDDCDTVVSYVYNDDNSYNGILLDQNAITNSITSEDAYSTGEILKVKNKKEDGLFTYEYKIFNVKGTYTWTTYLEEFGELELNKLDSMITQMNGKGSISIMSNAELKGKTLAYYAYTYSDEVDEHILNGNDTIKIGIDKHLVDAGVPNIQDFYVSRTHIYNPPGKGCLGTYVNGIQVKSIDSETVECKYHIDTPIMNGFVKTWGNKADLYPMLKEIDDTTSISTLIAWKEGKYSAQLSEYSITSSLLEKLKGLSNSIKQSETENELHYYVERLEAGETYSVDRSWLNWSNRYTNFDNTYSSLSFIGPGAVNVYLNGVMLDKSSYSIFDNNNIILNGLQVAGGSDEFDIDNEETHRLIKYYIEKTDPATGKTKGEIKRLYCETPDEIMVEFRPDTTIKKVSYEIKETSYDTNGIFTFEDYDFPNSLLTTKDTIKIYIDGILYTGAYKIENKNIVLENCPLQQDPIKLYFDTHPDTYREWKKENGEYSYNRSRIIFEWR